MNNVLQRQLDLETKIATILGYGFILNAPAGLFYRAGKVPKFTRDWSVIGPLMIEYDCIPTHVSYDEYESRQEAFMFSAGIYLLTKLQEIKAAQDKVIQDELDAKRAASAEQLRKQKEREAQKAEGKE